MWVCHRRFLHTVPSVRCLAQRTYAENILAYCWDGIFEGSVALWRHILEWSRSSPRWDNLPSGHQRNPLLGLILWYMYWGQKSLF